MFHSHPGIKLASLAVFLISGCSGAATDPGSGVVDGIEQPLTVPGFPPVPCCLTETGPGTPYPCSAPWVADEAVSEWSGSVVDLLVADALAECTAGDPSGDHKGFSAFNVDGDAYLLYVANKMNAAVPDKSFPYVTVPGALIFDVRDTFERWRQFRAYADRQCDFDSMTPNVPADLDVNHGVKESIGIRTYQGSGSNSVEERTTLANADLRTAGINYCIAQRLRTKVPGVSSGVTLLLPEGEQRYVLELIRERAQIAMLQYALLGTLWSAPNLRDDPFLLNFASPYRIPDLQFWGTECATASGGTAPGCVGGGQLSAMGRDFAAAVQLHIAVTQELQELLWRSGDARRTRGDSPPTRVDDRWGAGSWWQRQYALLHGGDPLAMPANAPWQHPLGQMTLGDGNAALRTPGWAGWPDQERIPYFHTSATGPQIQQLLNFARQFDLLKFDADLSTCPQYVNTDAVYQDFYKTVEGYLRAAVCSDKDVLGNCITDPATLKPTTDYPGAAYLLADRFAIRPEHAKALVAHLVESIASPIESACASSASDARLGPMDVHGKVEFTNVSGTSAKLHFGRTFELVSPHPEELAPKFTRLAPLRYPIPSEIVRTVSPVDYGFGDRPGLICLFGATTCPRPVDVKRSEGAMPALAAVRFMVMNSLVLGAARPEAVQFLQRGSEIVQLINAAIGEQGGYVRPNVALSTDQHRLVMVQTGSGPTQWLVGGTRSDNDAFWAVQPGDQYRICVSADPLAAPLAAEPGPPSARTSLFGITIGSVSAVCGAAFNPNPAINNLAFRWADSPKFWQGTVQVPASLSSTASWLVARLRGATVDTRLLAGQIAYVRQIREGQFVSTGGVLGQKLQNASALLPTDRTRPATDSFGYPTDWVPPLSGELVGGAADQPSSDFYLALAESAAAEASTATEKAVADLVAQEQDQALVSAAASRASAGVKEERDAECGVDNTNCEDLKEPAVTQVDAAWYPSNIPQFPAGLAAGVDCSCVSNGQVCSVGGAEANTKAQVACLAFLARNAVVGTKVAVAGPVLDHINDTTVPGFEDYKGGELQSAFIAQWGALKAPGPILQALEADRAKCDASVHAAEVALAALQDEFRADCGMSGWLEGLASGLSLSVGSSASVSWSPAAAIAQMNRCESLMRQIAPAQANAVLAEKAAVAEMVSDVSHILDSQVAMVQSGANIERVMAQTRLRQKNYELEGKLAAATVQSSFGLVRSYRSYDLWRAKAQLENARRYALAARRSIEARYVVDLSELARPESFVQSPATWADEVYGYDLSMPSSVGLAVGQSAPGGVYTNVVKDYVQNLRGFVSGYAAGRPSAVAHDEIDVVDLPGLASEATTFDGATEYLSRGQWSVQCPGSSDWLAMPRASPASMACGAGAAPTRVRLSFSLDPWGRVDGLYTSLPYKLRFNTRWNLVAVNVVGTGVKDCANAVDTLGCYANGSLPYDLTQVGPALVTDFEQIWRTQAIPIGRIEGGKALAAELWLDPLKDGWSTSYISAVKRTEFAFRPVGGAYALEFAVGPEVELDHIERIQLMLGSTYWVKQN